MTSHLVVDWDKVVRIASALLTPLIAVAATVIALQQHLVSRRQYRLSLFEKRLAVFNSVMKMIASIVREGKAELGDCYALIQETREHEFLFGPEIGSYIN